MGGAIGVDIEISTFLGQFYWAAKGMHKLLTRIKLIYQKTLTKSENLVAQWFSFTIGNTFP